ncbi:hypothetical protein OW944_23400 [Klebsiella pneumoniae]|uniref:hypothetical protein n=1 Tax=Klebsiella quasipneumoniae TaxID=1463165 RepID=UPI001CFF2745|nr:hypothetical protein [Klebsiella quasipneumoniae]MDN2606815.1 hypothetical protein [Klebsiella variicola]MDV5689624.1 hypothetical protein [Klebsiella quasipneumoniae]
MNNRHSSNWPESKGIQAIPDGVLEAGKVTGYTAIIRSLDAGRHDKYVSQALRLLSCVFEAKEKGWYRISIENEVILWRWLVVTVFLIEQRNLNGTADVPNDSGGFDRAVIYRGKNGGMSIYPAPERFCLANNIESLAIEKYGSVIGPAKALQIYQGMVTTGQEGFELSPWGRDAFETLHYCFIEQLQTNGMPDMPVMH